jgi:outer membrane murein-binding lipoprotein Lpp
MADSYGRIPPYERIEPEASRTNFTVVRRGFDPQEVRALLAELERELELAARREAELRDALEQARHDAAHPVIDEQMLTAALGERSAEILRSSHEEARALLEQVRAKAAEMMAEAQERADEISVDAEQRAAARLADAELTAGTLETKALDAARRTVAQARADGETLVDRARAQGRSMIDQAQEARERILSDMNGRRRAMHVQIEQLRAARDHLATSIFEVRATIDRLTSDIANSDEAARAAAEEVARRQPTLPEVDLADFEATFEDAVPRPSAAEAVVGVGSEEDLAADAAAPEPGVVEELFAKIRASAHDERDESATRSAPGAAPEAAPEPDAHDVRDLAARDGALSAARASLARKVKRALQDQQNHLLDAVRGAREPSAALLGAETDQIAGLAAAAVDPLRDAAAAGRAYAVDHGVSAASELSDVVLMRLADALASGVVLPLRRRLEEAVASADPSAELSAAFREWRGGRLERAVGDAALEAFSAGAVAACEGIAVRWVASGGTSACPDCADDALEPAVPAGQAFPTGHVHPPAHPGCNCAIVPVLA